MHDDGRCWMVMESWNGMEQADCTHSLLSWHNEKFSEAKRIKKGGYTAKLGSKK